MTIAGTWDVGSGFSPSFSLPLLDAGAGAVNTAALMSMGSGTPTFTRATTAWTKLSTGLWVSVASGTARSRYLGFDTTVGAYGGYLAEGARTNDALWCRDLTNVAWGKGATITVAKTATGIDGVANSATTVTGGVTAATNIVTQAITLASQADTFSCFVKRITGTGAVSLTLDNVTYTDISSKINASTYTQVQITQTVLNPTIGIKVTANGDSVAVDMCQMEPGGFASSPIPTTTVAVTRNADVLLYPTSGNIKGTAGSAYAEIMSNNIAAGQTFAFLSSYNGGADPIFLRSNSLFLGIYDGTGNNNGNAIAASPSIQKIASRWSGTAANTFLAGAASSNFTLAQTMVPTTNIGIGNSPDGFTNASFSTIRNVKIYPAALSAAQLQAMTT